MGQENEYVFEEASGPKKSQIAGIGKFLWNSRTKEFCGRDGASWGKVSLFYAIFYLGLGSFFIGMLAVFFQIMPKDKPTYYGETSLMNSRGCKLNPGLGFRPQIDVEDSLIRYSAKITANENGGHEKQVNNLKNFLNAKYPDAESDENKDSAVACDGKNKAAEGKFCNFDYKKIFESSDCTEAKYFGYQSSKPCVLIKLNKIVGWQPDTKDDFIGIKCHGETAVDKDNVRDITFYSEGADGNLQKSTKEEGGRLQAKYYPYTAQKGYRAPFLWGHFDVKPNILVNIECNATANNIEYERLNKRGLTKFSLFVIEEAKN